MGHVAEHTNLILQPAVRSWLDRSGALSALPGAPVVPDEPRRRRRIRLAKRVTASPARPRPVETGVTCQA